MAKALHFWSQRFGQHTGKAFASAWPAKEARSPRIGPVGVLHSWIYLYRIIERNQYIFVLSHTEKLCALHLKFNNDYSADLVRKMGMSLCVKRDNNGKVNIYILIPANHDRQGVKNIWASTLQIVS
jgi:hypothetical protein